MDDDRATVELRQTLEAAATAAGRPLEQLTVLDRANDPFRVDTPARHRDGGWLATTARDLGLGDRRIHLRGLHYMVIGRPKPDGTPYANNDKDWNWLSEDAGKAARWLGYLSFDQIIDQRNSVPTVRAWQPSDHESEITAGIYVQIPDVADIRPSVGVWDRTTEESEFHGTQRYKLVMVGEKASLGDVLSPIAEKYKADLYLPAGELSDTHLYQMARVGADDGRTMVVLYFSDADPAGWQMPISAARKLQALQVGWFPALKFEVRRVALTPDQVREYGLPVTPLKDTEQRADEWRRAMGVAQTEVDALGSLRPDLLRRLAEDAIAPFYDHGLDWRTQMAYNRWRTRAQARVDAATADRIRSVTPARLNELRGEIDDINSVLRVNASDFDLPPIVVPTANDNRHLASPPLFDSRWPFVDQTLRLIDSKAYRGGS
jgi:hypothetical protein